VTLGRLNLRRSRLLFRQPRRPRWTFLAPPFVVRRYVVAAMGRQVQRSPAEGKRPGCQHDGAAVQQPIVECRDQTPARKTMWPPLSCPRPSPRLRPLSLPPAPDPSRDADRPNCRALAGSPKIAEALCGKTRGSVMSRRASSPVWIINHDGYTPPPGVTCCLAPAICFGAPRAPLKHPAGRRPFPGMARQSG
jgi:hypothetical protein